MPVVYLADQGASVSKRGDRLYVFKGPELLRWFHTKDISQLIVVGNISLTTPTLTYLLKNKVDTVFTAGYVPRWVKFTSGAKTWYSPVYADTTGKW